MLRIELPAETSLEAIGRDYADAVEAEGWKMITIQCIESNLTDSVRIGGRKWLDDFDASLSIEIREPLNQGDGTAVSVSLAAPFHTSDGDRHTDGESANDCDW